MGAANTSVVVLILLSLTCCALAKHWIPSSIEVPESCALRQSLHAKGYQYYRFNGTAWEGFNAKARLYDAKSKRQVGHHFYLAEADARGGQPTWTSYGSHHVPHSSVTGKPVAKAVVDRDSITWVLLESTQTHGNGAYFGNVVFVQRVNTEMGLAPAKTSGACEGDVKKVRYTADYLFYVGGGSGH